MPVAAYAGFREDQTIDPAKDDRWNIEALIKLLFNELPNQAKMDIARISQAKEVQRKVASTIINACSVLSGAVGFIPLGFADLPPLLLIQSIVIISVAYISGRKLLVESFTEFLAILGVQAAIGTGIKNVLRTKLPKDFIKAIVKLIAQESSSFIPIANIANGVIAATATKNLGKASIAYFIDEEPKYVVRKIAQKAK